MAPPAPRRPGFSRRAQYSLFVGYVVAGFGILVAAALLIVATVSPRAFAGLRTGAAEVTAPISSALGSLFAGIAGTPGEISDYVAVHRQNAELRAELTQAHRLLQTARTLAFDNRRLRGLLALREASAHPVVTARLVSSTATSTRRFAILNAGTSDGVAAGQPVRGPDGLVGRILEVGPNVARVLLLTDPESAVPIRRTRDGLPAIAVGRGDAVLEIRSASISRADFHVGDVFVTSGAGGIYAPGTPVAQVIGVGKDLAYARPFSHPTTFDYALVESIFLATPPERPSQP